MPSMGSNIKDIWFHGKAARAQVEELVQKAGCNGSFAVRTSDSIPGGYTISLLSGGRVYTYRIIPTEGKYALETSSGVQKKKFVSIEEMINEYRKAGNGMACGLTNPVGKPPSSFQRIKPDLPARAIPLPRTALSMPLPPVPNVPPRAQVPTAPPASLVMAPPRPPLPPSLQATIISATVNSGYTPAGMLATVTGAVPAARFPARLPLPSGSHMQPIASAPTQEYHEPSEQDDAKCCKICMDAEINAFFQPCGHVCCCMDCSKRIKECPLCRKKIAKFHKAYIP